MKVIIDTNVAVSGLLWGGPPNRIMRWIRDRLLTAYGCEKTTEELNRTLNYVKFSKRFQELNTNPEEVFAYFMNLIHYVPVPKNIPGIIKKDLFYNIFLALAVQNNVSLIISGDDHSYRKRNTKISGLLHRRKRVRLSRLSKESVNLSGTAPCPGFALTKTEAFKRCGLVFPCIFVLN